MAMSNPLCLTHSLFFKAKQEHAHLPNPSFSCNHTYKQTRAFALPFKRKEDTIQPPNSLPSSPLFLSFIILYHKYLFLSFFHSLLLYHKKLSQEHVRTLLCFVYFAIDLF